MIRSVRVDHRLLHRQVIFSWTKQYDTNHIIVTDNKVPGDPMFVMALTITKPTNYKLDIVKISGVKGIMETSPNDNYMILIKKPKKVFGLVQDLPEIKEINSSGVPKRSESKQYGKAVFLIPEELEATKKILDREVKIFVQQVPSSSIENVDFSK